MLLLFLFESNFFFCLDYSRVNNLLEFVNLWFQKKQKIKPEYFYPKNHRTYFPIATPAARAPHSTWGPLHSASAEILTVIFWFKNIRASGASCCDCYFLFGDNFYFFSSLNFSISCVRWIFDFLDVKSNKKIKPPYFYAKNYRTYFHIATSAACVSHSTQVSITAASAEILSQPVIITPPK
jgi:hypothetical protein